MISDDFFSRFGAALAAFLLCLGTVNDGRAQFESTWLDVGDYHDQYFESGAGNEGNIANDCKKWRAIESIEYSDHCRAKAWWIGVRNWTDETGRDWPYFVNLIGPRTPGVDRSYPVEHELVSRYGDPADPEATQPAVFVEGGQSFDQVALVDRVDPNLPSDRMVRTVTNTTVGVTMERNIYAFTNEFHDDYHIHEYVYRNTGNTDSDPEIELEGQTLEDVYIYRIHRETGQEQGAISTGSAQTWGKWTMVDVVGDGFADYDVDFRATYSWIGWTPEQSRYNNLGGPLWDDSHVSVAPGDSIGRLAGATMTGRVTIFGEAPGNEGSYSIDDFAPSRSEDAADVSAGTADVPEVRQPHILGYQDQDGPLTATGARMEDYYRIGILADGENQGRFPHYANLIEPDGNFATTENDASSGKQGGFAATVAYGPYDLEFGEAVRIVVADAAGGLTWAAKRDVGRAYKRSGADDSLHIAFDANGDGQIQGTENDVPGSGVSGPKIDGDESLTKNQWVLTSRDSLFVNFQRAIDNYWSGFDIPAPPAPPQRFDVVGRPDRVELTWETYGDEPAPQGWEIYRTDRFVENLPYTKIAELDGSARSYNDEDLQRGIDYYYYLAAVGENQPIDPSAIAGTPGGKALRSSRYYAQTFTPVQLKRPPGEELNAFRIVPNPFNLAMDADIRWPDQEDKLGFLDLPGECTIEIYTEAGELVQTILHTDGSGDEFWNMTTSSRQLLVSGIYIAVVTDHTRGDEQLIQKFAIIR